MINQRVIKKRLLSIKNIKKISKALEMVSASKVQKAQTAAMHSKPFAEKIYNLMRTIDIKQMQKELPLLRTKKVSGNRLIILVTTNKGLCGSINNNLLRKLSRDLEKQVQGSNFFITIGKKGQSFCVNNGTLLADYSSDQDIDDVVNNLTQNIINDFVSEKVDEVHIYYTDFVTAIYQAPLSKIILPFVEEEKYGGDFLKESRENEKTNYNYEPSAKKLLQEILPFYIESVVRDVIYESIASEHSARMVAMKNATDNAEHLSYSLELEYNKARQQQITNEIAEIVTATMTI